MKLSGPLPIPERLRARWPRGLPLPELWKLGACQIMKGREPVDLERAVLRWHLSISHPSRLPTWAELRQIRDELIPEEICMAIPYPPRAWWLSVHPNCLHLWEIEDPELLALWREEGENAARKGFGEPEPAREVRTR